MASSPIFAPKSQHGPFHAFLHSEQSTSGVWWCYGRVNKLALWESQLTPLNLRPLMRRHGEDDDGGGGDGKSDRSWHDVISSLEASFVLMEPKPKRKRGEERFSLRGAAFVPWQKDIDAKIWPTMILSKRQIFMASHCFQTKWSPSRLVSKLFTVYASAFSPRLCVDS